MHALIRAIHDGYWADLASVVGVLISIVGFIVTIVQVAKSKSAARQTAEAVADVRQKLALHSVVSDLSTLMNEVEEIKALHRLGVWQVLPTRYAAIRRQLLSIRGNNPNLSKRQKSVLLGVIQQFQEIEEVVEVALAARSIPEDSARLTTIASNQADKLVEILSGLQQTIGEA